MHNDVELHLPHAETGKLYIEDGGRWVVHVFPDLASSDAQDMAALRDGLGALIGRETGFDEFVIHPNDVANARQS